MDEQTYLKLLADALRAWMTERWRFSVVDVAVVGQYPDAIARVKIDGWVWEHPVWHESTDNEPELGDDPAAWEPPARVAAYLATWCLEAAH